MDTKNKPMKPFYHFIHRLVRFLYKHLYHHRVIGLENVPAGPAILAPNHTSFLDPPMVGISINDEIHYLARGTLFAFPPFAWLIRNLNAHPVIPGTKDKSALDVMEKIVRNGDKVTIFPEGIRSADNQLQTFRQGAATLALRTKCPIVPVYINGAFDIWNKDQILPKLWGKTICIFGPPLTMDAYENLPESEAKEKILKDLYVAICKLRDTISSQ